MMSDLTDLAKLPPPPVSRRVGWYPDPTGAPDQRYWNGYAWTKQTRSARETRVQTLAIWGIIAGLLLPIVGVVIAIVLFVRNEIGPGIAALLASGLGVFFYSSLPYLTGS
jgi:hypothetical protein